MLRWKAQTSTRRTKQEYEVLWIEITESESLSSWSIKNRGNIRSWIAKRAAQSLQHGLGC